MTAASERNEFPKAHVTLDDSSILTVPSYLWFFTRTHIADQAFQFVCLLCGVSQSVDDAKWRNVKRHLRSYCKNKELVSDWMTAYDADSKYKKQAPLTAESLKLVKLFISCNMSIINLRNEHFRDYLKISLPDVKTFTDTMLPQIMELIHKRLNDKLCKAEFVCFISDIWTTKRMFDFMGLAARITYSNFARETITIGNYF